MSKTQKKPTVEDSIALLERASIAASQPRYMRNSGLQQVIRTYRATAEGIKQHQARIDAKFDRLESETE